MQKIAVCGCTIVHPHMRFFSNCNYQVVSQTNKYKNKEKHRHLAWKTSYMSDITRWWLGGFKSIHWANNFSNAYPYVLHQVQYNLLSNCKKFFLDALFVNKISVMHIWDNLWEYIIKLIDISDKRTNQNCVQHPTIMCQFWIKFYLSL